MAKHLVLIVLFLLQFSAEIFPQTVMDEEKAKRDFNKAYDLRDKAWRLVKKDSKGAEKLYEEANHIYPGSPGFSSLSGGISGDYDYLPYLRLHEMDDIKGANRAWDSAIKKLSELPGFVYGYKKSLKKEFIPVADYLRNIYLLRAYMNMTWGDVNLAFDDVEKIIAIGFTKDHYSKQIAFPSEVPPSIQSVFRECIYLAFLCEDKKMVRLLNTQFKDVEDNDFTEVGEVYLKMVNGYHEEAISLLKELENKNVRLKIWARYLLAGVYAKMGDTGKSKEYLNLLSKNIYVDERTLLRIKLLNAINENDYEEALGYATSVLKPRKLHRQPGKFYLHKLRADVYAAMKIYTKAREDYQAALIYNPDYEPALNGLARLEGRIITERLTDKVPPQINITAPVLDRGIIIEAAESEVMIKGTATDPGGLKSVTINGEKAYSQEGGDFWGNVVLSEGANKVIITAADFSGNIAEKVVEINRAVGSSAAKAIQVKEGKNYALLIGCQNYNDNKIPSLEDPIPDAVKLKLILKNNYHFTDENLFTLFNPEVSDFKKQFLEIYEVIQPEDKLVIFYAGHGIWNEKEKKGYWMLTDAKLDDPNTWLPNRTVLDMIARVPARHTLLITDACFSGSVFKTRGLDLGKKDETSPTMVQRMNEKISRVAITSGNDTEVPDKSVFMKYLVKALSENKEKYLTAQKMFINHIIESVMTETKTEPRYGTLELAGHVGGDFIFIKR